MAWLQNQKINLNTITYYGCLVYLSKIKIWAYVYQNDLETYSVEYRRIIFRTKKIQSKTITFQTVEELILWLAENGCDHEIIM